MPTNREKRPRWLMICKCGATVKASASRGRNHPIWHVRATDEDGLREDRRSRDPPKAATVRAGSGVRYDGGVPEGAPARTLTGALKQRLTLGCGRPHDRKTGQHRFPHGPEI